MGTAVFALLHLGSIFAAYVLANGCLIGRWVSMSQQSGHCIRMSAMVTLRRFGNPVAFLLRRQGHFFCWHGLILLHFPHLREVHR